MRPSRRRCRRAPFGTPRPRRVAAVSGSRSPASWLIALARSRTRRELFRPHPSTGERLVKGRCNSSALGASAASQRSTSSGVVRPALPWGGSARRSRWPHISREETVVRAGLSQERSLALGRYCGRAPFGAGWVCSHEEAAARRTFGARAASRRPVNQAATETTLRVLR
jgi:hypothetical protein